MSKKTWEGTSVPSLLRNRSSGKYYGRWKITVNGKSKWRWLSLKTDLFSVAKLRLADESHHIARLRGSRVSVEAGTGTMGDFIFASQERTKANADLKPASIASRLYALKRVVRTWPELSGLKPSQVTPAAVAAWAKRLKGEGTNFLPPGAKTAIRGNSATSINHAIDALRRLFSIAVEQGALHSNPANVKSTEGRLKKKIPRTKLALPSFPNVQRIFGAIENSGAVGGWAVETADFCRFLAYTGCRISEVKGVTWQDVDWERKQLHIKGLAPANSDHYALKTESSNRIVPLFTDLNALLKKVMERRKKTAVHLLDGQPLTAQADRVFRLSECQKAINAACKRLGIERITHHDFRHLFATRCIESGVDIPTVSRWLGHADGGALAMRTYGHLRQEHSLAQSAKVTFGGQVAVGAESGIELSGIAKSLNLPAGAAPEAILAALASAIARPITQSAGVETPRELRRQLDDSERRAGIANPG